VDEFGPVLGKSVSELLRSERALRGHVTRELDNALKAKITADETTSTKPDAPTEESVEVSPLVGAGPGAAV